MKEDSVRSHLEQLINRHLFGMASTVPIAPTEHSGDKGRNWEEVG
jgi:hypothetical protein